MADQSNQIALTEKQEAFCQSYLIDFNGARAARDAGYAADSANVEASRLLTNANIQARINELRVQMGKAFNITRERIAQEYARIGFVDIRNIFDENGKLKDPKDWSDDEAAAIAGLESENIYDGKGEDREMIGYLKKVKLTDKKGALDSLVKLMGYAAPDKTSLTDPDGNAVQPIININVIRKEKLPNEDTDRPNDITTSL